MKCTYCGEGEATKVIMNPNIDEEKATWDVCKDCKDTIAQQQRLSFGMFISTMKNKNGEIDDFNKKFGKKIINKANKQLDKIAKKNKKPIFNACLTRQKDGKYESSSIEFTGEK